MRPARAKRYAGESVFSRDVYASSSIALLPKLGYSGGAKKIWILPLILVVVVGLALAGCQATRAGYASTPYKVVRSYGELELRDYPALAVVA